MNCVNCQIPTISHNFHSSFCAALFRRDTR